jgi:hypothetical protein
VADGVGFEPTEGLHLRRFSRPVHSTALPPIHRGANSSIGHCGPSQRDLAEAGEIRFAFLEKCGKGFLGLGRNQALAKNVRFGSRMVSSINDAL